MTTEILRSMLYRGSEVLKEISFVIFDEIHYIRDRERGVVWEETIILLPDSVKFVFLSATIPNARQFAGWITSIHNQPCHVIYPDYRPTPLQHYMFPGGGDGIYLVVDEKGKFREQSFQQAISSIKSAGKSFVLVARKANSFLNSPFSQNVLAFSFFFLQKKNQIAIVATAAVAAQKDRAERSAARAPIAIYTS